MSDFTLEQLTESYKTEENVEKTPEQIAKEKRWAEEAESRRRNVYVPTDPNDGSDKEALAANDEVRDMVIEFVKRYIRLQLKIKKRTRKSSFFIVRVYISSCFMKIVCLFFMNVIK